MSVAWVEDSDIVDVTVTGADPKEARAGANAVAEAIPKVSPRQSENQVQLIQSAGDDRLSSGRLKHPKAEAARWSQLGSAIAAQQSGAAVNSTSVLPVARATNAVATGISDRSVPHSEDSRWRQTRRPRR